MFSGRRSFAALVRAAHFTYVGQFTTISDRNQPISRALYIKIADKKSAGFPHFFVDFALEGLREREREAKSEQKEQKKNYPKWI